MKEHTPEDLKNPELFNQDIHQLLESITEDSLGFEGLAWTDDTKGYWFNKLNDWYLDQRANHEMVDIRTFFRSTAFGDEPCSIEEYCETLYKWVTMEGAVKLPVECLDDEDKYQAFMAKHRDDVVDVSGKIF